jgi:hypothetical protein
LSFCFLPNIRSAPFSSGLTIKGFSGIRRNEAGGGEAATDKPDGGKTPLD